jgi:D-erythronate 2-dehydrogenase
MQIIITGGAGFLGARLAREILKAGELAINGNAPKSVTSVVLIDRVVPPPDLANDSRVTVVVGDLNALLSPAAMPSTRLGGNAALVYHLAAAVSGECEADFDLGMRSNLDATRALLEMCRALPTPPMVVFASSLAVFGNSAAQPLPDVIEDNTLPTPQNSYGIQKFIGEQLVADYGRKGFVTARNVRLMTVSVRPGKPNGAASSFLSGMIREPLNGESGRCPVPAATAVALSSPDRTIEGLLRAASASQTEWGALTAVNLPAISTTAGAMAEALARIAGKPCADLIDWTPDANIARIVSSWPAKINAVRAKKLGLVADVNIDSLIEAYLSESKSTL